MNNNANSKLNEIKSELRSIIRELDEIAEDLPKFKGVGAERCVESLHAERRRLQTALSRLEKIKAEDLIEKGLIEALQ